MITETKLDEGQKEAIIRAARAYKMRFATVTEPDGLSDSKLADLADISKAYMSAMMNGNWDAMKAGNTTVAVKDLYFKRLAKAVDFSIERVYWRHFDLTNYNACMNAFDDALVSGKPVCIVGNTGSGKSYSIDNFLRMRPEGTYRINMDSDMTKNAFLHELCEVLNVKAIGSAYRMRKAIEKKLLNEKSPALIVDECENAKKKDAVFGSLKAIMDAVKGHCPVILVGTPDLKRHIEKEAAKEKTPFFQLKRRIKEGVGFVELFDQNEQEVKDMCAAMGIQQKDCVKLISHKVDNVGELSGSIEKLLREIEEGEHELSLELIEQVL
jgi:hypothetical protein